MNKILEKICNYIAISSSCGYAGPGQYTKRHGLMMVVFLVVIFGITQIIPAKKSYAAIDNSAADEVWEAKKIVTAVTVIDIDPARDSGLMIHFNSGWWENISRDKWTGNWPAIGETGTLYNKNGKIHKWKLQSKPKSKPKLKIKATPKIVVKKVDTYWLNLSTLPEINKVVVVRFDDTKTSTAYLNKYSEWKLDINKGKYKGGKTITNIIEWKDVGI